MGCANGDTPMTTSNIWILLNHQVIHTLLEQLRMIHYTDTLDTSKLLSELRVSTKNDKNTS